MAKAAVVDDETRPDDPTLEEEEEEEEEEESPRKRTDETRKRKLLADENVYVYVSDSPLTKDAEVSEFAQSVREKAKSLRYEDHTEVEGFRVFHIWRGYEEDSDGNKVSGKLQACVLSRSADQALALFADSRGYSAKLAFRKKGRGRAKSKISSTLLEYGKLLADIIFENGQVGKFVDNPNKSHLKNWNSLFAAGGEYAHYLDESNNWKKPTD